MFLVDTDVISETRKGKRCNAGVHAFFARAITEQWNLHLSVIVLGELRQGVERIRHRGDAVQARQLESWLQQLSVQYTDSILPFDQDMADLWGRLRVPHPENPLDKQIAATALLYELTVVTRNVTHYAGTGVRILNPFSP